MLTAPEFTLTGPRPGSQTDLNFIGPHQSFIAHSLLPKRTGLSRQTDWTKSGLKGTGLPKSLSLYLQLRPIQNQEVDHRKEGGADSYSADLCPVLDTCGWNPRNARRSPPLCACPTLTHGAGASPGP
ncbi:uncharacterized protein LOC129352662 isoform X2 [Poeciliopsis prolifica]|uniref:uncharacterized protein LOC129352662 isoform X2 n=1 Tax=Poeciliopsis prolifica TaxID=188132 RepID=UPI00241432C5|nr:uncharacterized protein LOC129352662 isoform X2 [Poeciliopsis prolifica]